MQHKSWGSSFGPRTLSLPRNQSSRSRFKLLDLFAIKFGRLCVACFTPSPTDIQQPVYGSLRNDYRPWPAGRRRHRWIRETLRSHARSISAIVWSYCASDPVAKCFGRCAKNFAKEWVANKQAWNNVKSEDAYQWRNFSRRWTKWHHRER